MAKRLTITNTRPSHDTLWYFQTNPPQHNSMREWLQDNSDKVTFHFDFQNDTYVQVLEYTFADEATANEFIAFADTGNLGSAMEDYHASVGITSTQTITDV